MRQPDGRIVRVRIEESTRETSKTRAARFAADRAQYYHEQAYRPKAKAGPSFTDAAITYVETKHPSKRDRDFVAKLVGHFGDTPIADIDQAAVSSAAHALFPGLSASTHNRAVYAPVVTILRISGERPDFRRPRIHRKPIFIPEEEWFDAVLPHCPNRLAALLVFLTFTGRRITEALDATVGHALTEVYIGQTKTGTSLVVPIPELVRQLIPDRLRTGKRLFGYVDRHNVYRALRKACKRAGVPYYGTHALGRHSFATRLLREGFSTKFVAGAGGWASTRMVDLHYGHLAKDEVQDEVRKVGEDWGRKLAERQKTKENG